jgi:sirohydrochlorin cobaltochelatase
MTSSHKTAVLLFAHGARDPRWAEPFEAVERRVASAAPNALVTLAFLEFMQPSLPVAGAALAAAGCTRVDVVPLFLGAGGHVRKDLPALMDALSSAHVNVRWHLHPAIGEVESVVDAMASAALAFAGAALPGKVVAPDLAPNMAPAVATKVVPAVATDKAASAAPDSAKDRE